MLVNTGVHAVEYLHTRFYYSDVKMELPYLMERLKPCKYSWFAFGFALGVTFEELQGFESESKGPVLDRCLLETLRFWLNSGDAKLDILVKAVELCGHKDLSKEIEAKYKGD